LDSSAIENALRRSGADLSPGLSESEIDRLEERHGFHLAPDHRVMLSIALSLDRDGRWPDWRKGDPDVLRKRVEWPIEGILFDVQQNSF
jgi:hypothetical protein